MNTTKPSQTEITQPPKPRGYHFWLTRFALLLGLSLLFYYGYCFGLWGRRSLLLQYLFQCNCPVASEEARYPRSVDVIVPACSYISSILSPSGRFLYLNEERSDITATYLLDLQDSKRISFTLPESSSFYFLTDDLLFLSLNYGGGERILDRITGEQYPIRKFAYSRQGAYINGEVNLNLLAEALRESGYVFYKNYNGTIVALAPDFQDQPDRNFFLSRSDFPDDEVDQVEQFLRENNIIYQTILADFPGEAISLDGRFVARSDGIYLVITGQKIIEGSFSSVRGWTNDSSGMIYSRFNNPCLIHTNFGVLDDSVCYFEVPQPLLKLKMPDQYLLPTQTP